MQQGKSPTEREGCSRPLNHLHSMPCRTQPHLKSPGFWLHRKAFRQPRGSVHLQTLDRIMDSAFTPSVHSQRCRISHPQMFTDTAAVQLADLSDCAGM